MPDHAVNNMLENSTITNMTGLTQPRPRTSETEGLISQSSDVNISAGSEDLSDHGNDGSYWGLFLQVGNFADTAALCPVHHPMFNMHALQVLGVSDLYLVY